jgi:parallel beta-helix repeat protein
MDMGWLRRSFIVVLAVAGLLPVGLAAPTSAAATLLVDDDRVQCRNAAFSSIQAAVDAASPGDTVRVCAGLYRENVQVNKTLTLIGSGPTGRQRTGNPAAEAVVEGDSVIGTFYLNANNIAMSLFTVRNNPNAPGIYTTPAFSGYRILNNLLQGNVFGLYLNTSGNTRSFVANNAFRFNTAAGAANGNGIYSDQGLRRVTIETNFFTGHFNTAMVFAGNLGTQTDLLIQRNTLVDDNGIVFFNTTNAVVQSNSLTRTTDGSGIYVGANSRDFTISANTIRDGAFSGVAVRNYDGFGLPATPPTNITIQNNTILNNGVDGVSFTDADGNTVRGNRIESNRRDGIRMGTDTGTNGESQNNLIDGNRLARNVEHDCHDDSNGTRTAGTANTWTNNAGQTENRVGLCRGARFVP